MFVTRTDIYGLERKVFLQMNKEQKTRQIQNRHEQTYRDQSN